MLLQTVKPHIRLFRDRVTGIAWVEDRTSGCGHSAHPNISVTGDPEAVYGRHARIVKSHGFAYNVSSLVVTDVYDELARRHCRCGGFHGDAKLKRLERFLSYRGVPKFVRCYDNGGETADRYTVVFTNLGKAIKEYRGRSYYIGMSGAPFHPQGIGQRGESDHQIDRPTYSHLGKKISFDALPEDCKELVMHDYRDLWKL